jgi:RHS repeat-associated protein
MGWTNQALIDLDGDGVLDAVFNDQGPVWSLWRGKLVGGKLAFDLDNLIDWPAPSAMAKGSKVSGGTQPQYSYNRAQIMLLDVDGNGRPDLVRHNPDIGEYVVHPNKGDGFPLSGNAGDRIFSLNASRDAFPFLSLSVTEDFVPPYTSFVENGQRYACIRPTDYDHDGRVDFAACTNLQGPFGTPEVGYNRGDSVGPPIDINKDFDHASGFFEIVIGETDGSNPVWNQRRGWIDLDGDGLEESINLDTTNQLQQAHGEYIGYQGMEPPRRMIAIDNGRGLTTSISYAPHTDETIVDPGAGRLPRATMVVKSIERTDTHGAGGTTEFSYRGPVFNADDDGKHGFRGFDEARTKSPLGALTVNRYDYDLDWSGRLVETLVFESEADYGGDESTSSVDEAVSITRVDWRSDSELCDVFGADIETFLTRDTDSYTCSNGQTIDDCLSSGAIRRDRTTWAKLPSASDIQVCRPKIKFRYTGKSKSVGDRFMTYTYKTVSDALNYRIRRVIEITKEYVEGGGNTMVARNDNIWSADGRTLDQTRLTISPDVQTINYTYDPLGNVLTKKLPDRPPQQFDYSAATFHLYPVSITNELGHVVEQDLDLGTGNVLEVRGPNEAAPGDKERTKTDYDALGRPVKQWVTVDDGAGGYELKPQNVVRYFDFESPQRVRTGTWVNHGDFCSVPAGEGCVSVDETFDGHGRLISSTQIQSGDDAVTTHTYDAAGNVAATTVPDPSDVSGSSSVTYTTDYDSLGRPTAFSTPATAWSDLTMEYDGLTVTRTTMLGPTVPADIAEQARLTSDVHGRLVEVEEKTDSGGGGWSTTQYVYDAADALIQVTSADGVVTDIERNLAGWRTAITRAGRTWKYVYSKNGDMTAIVSPVPSGGIEADYATLIAYDDLGRPTSKLPAIRDMTQPELDELGVGLISYTYDQGPNAIGRLTHVDRGTVWTKDLSYDPRGNPISDTRTFSVAGAAGTVTDTRTQSFEYNAMGAMKAATFADDASQMAATNSWVEFDDIGRPVKLLSNRFGPEAVEVDYHTSGLVTTRRVTGLSSEIRRAVIHDSLGRVVIDEVKRSGDGSRSKQVFTYAGGLNRVTGLDTAVGVLISFPPLESFAFTYDKQNQIKTVAGPTSGANQYEADFIYTPGGRLDTATVTANPAAPLARTRDVTYEYGAGTNSDPEAVERLIDNGAGPDVASYAYDEAGNAVTRTEGSSTWAFVYGGEDQQRKVTAPDGSSEIYHYDESGMRNLVIERGSSGVVQKIRWYFGSTEIHYDGLGTETRTLVTDGLGAPQVRIRDKTTVEHLFHDGRGHLLVALDNGGTVKAGFTYGPFGEVLSAVGTPDDFVRRFNDKEFDQISSLSYYGARYYDPLALAWTQADPLYRFVPEFAVDEPRRANLYAFTLNNALEYADPEGLDAEGEKPLRPTWCSFTSNPGGCELGSEFDEYASYDVVWGDEKAKVTITEQKAEFGGGGNPAPYDVKGQLRKLAFWVFGRAKKGGKGITKGALITVIVGTCVSNPINLTGCALGFALGSSTSHGPGKGFGSCVSVGAGCVGARGCARGGAACAVRPPQHQSIVGVVDKSGRIVARDGASASHELVARGKGVYLGPNQLKEGNAAFTVVKENGKVVGYGGSHNFGGFMALPKWAREIVEKAYPK